MNKLKQNRYVPGVCNIGPAERARRRRGGIIATIIALALLAILIVIHAPILWRLTLFFPAFSAASGFLQDALHFCAGFGMRGLYNVVNSAGITNDVQSAEFRRQDRAKALTISAWSAVVGVAVALGCLWI